MSDRIKKEEEAFASAEKKATPKENTSPVKTTPEKSEKPKSSKKANVIGAIYSYINASNGLPKKTYTDGYVESELQRIERQGGIADNTLKQEEEWIKAQMEDMVKRGDYTNAYLAGYYN